jgi:hypothetical protein
LLALVVLVVFGTMACQPANSSGRLITVLNPALSAKLVERVPLAPRLDTLEGKTIYLYDTQWGGPDAARGVFEEMQAWFAKNMPSVKIIIYRGPNWMQFDEAFVKKVAAEKIDGVLIGISG